MPRPAVRGSLVLLLIGCASCTAPRHSGAPAACAAPNLQVARYAQAGGTIEIKGWSFMDDCADTGGPPAHGLKDIAIVLEQGPHRWPLTSVDADKDQCSFDVSVTVPPAAATGPAMITATPGRTVFRPAVAPIAINK